MTTIPEAQEGLLDPFAGMMNADAAQVILELRSSPEMQARAEVMAHKSREGQLTDEEQRQYESYADNEAMISLMQAHARRLHKDGIREELVAGTVASESEFVALDIENLLAEAHKRKEK